MNVLKYEKICKNMHKPSDAWQTIHFKRIMGSYDDFMKAKMKLKVAEEKSDLESEDPDKAKKVRKVNALKIFSTDSDDSTYGSMSPSSSLMIEPQQTQYVKRKGKKIKTQMPLNNDISHLKNLPSLPSPPFENNNMMFMKTTGPESPDLFEFNNDFSSSLMMDHYIPTSTPYISESTLVVIVSDQIDQPVVEENPAVQINDSKTQNILMENVIRVKFKINQMLEVMKCMDDKLNKLCSQQNYIDIDTQNSEVRNFFPLKTLKDIQDIEYKLKNDVVLRKQVIAELGYLGGHSSKEKTYGVMRYLLTNELASQITYCGFKKGKPGFMKFEVHNIAIEAIRSTSMGKTTNAKIISCMKNWLKHAKDRLKTDEKHNLNSNNMDFESANSSSEENVSE